MRLCGDLSFVSDRSIFQITLDDAATDRVPVTIGMTQRTLFGEFILVVE